MTEPNVKDLLDWIKLVAAVVGSGWALWTFHRLQKTRAAEADISQKIAETERTLAEVRAAEPLLQVVLEVTHERDCSTPGETVLNVTAELENKGAQNLYVSFDHSTIIAGHLEFAGDRCAAVRNVRRVPAVYVDDEEETKQFEYRIFRVGQKRSMTFTVSVKSAPTYYVQFRAWYVRFPFDAEEGTFQPGRSIRAIEQVFYTPDRPARELGGEQSAGSRSIGLLAGQ